MQQEAVKNIKNKEVVFKEEETKTQNKRTVSNIWFSANVFDLCKKKKIKCLRKMREKQII